MVDKPIRPIRRRPAPRADRTRPEQCERDLTVELAVLNKILGTPLTPGGRANLLVTVSELKELLRSLPAEGATCLTN